MYIQCVITLLALLFACGHDPKTVVNDDAVDEGAQAAPDQDLPILSVAHPPRASFQGTGSGVVSGKVERGSADVLNVMVNGEDADLAADGSYTLDVPYAAGIQLIGVRAEDADGQRAVDGRSVYAGPVNPPGELLTSALRFEIDSDILDDDDDEPDDIAALLEVVLNDPSLIELAVGVPVVASGFELIPTGVSFDTVEVDLAAGEGVLEAEVRVNYLFFDFDVVGTGVFSWVSTTGSATFIAADVGTDLSITCSGGRIRTVPEWVDVQLSGFEITVDWFPDSLEDELADFTENYLEETVSSIATDMLSNQVSEALDGLVVDMPLGPGLDIAASLNDIIVVPDSVRMVVDVSLITDSAFSLPEGAGSLRTVGEPPDWPISNGARLGIAVDDDFLNLISFAMWQSGVLSGINLPGSVVGALSGGAIPPPLGPVESIDMSVELPPVVSPPREPDTFDADISVGEWRIKFNREDGEIIDFSVNLRAGLQAEISGGTALDVHLDNRPAAIDLVVGVLESPAALDPGDLAALVRLMIPPLIGNSAELVPSIPIPTIPLSNFVDVDAIDGLELVIGDPEMYFSDEGWLLLQAELEVQ
jgi:hypothetical protein